MDLNDIPLFKAMTQHLAWLGQRQKVLAQNVANADTPHYRPSDLKPLTFSELVGKTTGTLQLAATEHGQMQGLADASPFAVERERGGEVSPSGNGVDLESEMLKVSSTANDYALTTNLYRQHIDMLRTVLGKSGG